MLLAHEGGGLHFEALEVQFRAPISTMTRHDVPLPLDADPFDIADLVQQSCLTDGLALTLRSTLAAHPGFTHWHWKRGRNSGTLEVTLWPQGHRLWVSVHANRAGEWAEEAAARLAASLAEALGTTFAQEKVS